MLSVSIAGIGGQGSVLAARILAQAAQSKGWQVRTAETIGMAQRGGNVISHVRMGDAGEAVYSPLPAEQSIDVLIALEPGEALRALPYVKQEGLIVLAQTPRPPIGGAGDEVYDARACIAQLETLPYKVVTVDDEALTNLIGSKKALNIIMLASALKEMDGAISLDDMKQAVAVCVKPQFLELNMGAIDTVLAYNNN